MLLGSERQVNQSPGHYSRSSVEEQFEIKRANPGVVLHTHEEIVEPRSTEASILTMTRKIVRFDVREESQAEAKHVGDDHQGSPVVTNDCGVDEALHNQDEEQNVCYNPSAYSITLVSQHIPSGGGRSSSNAAGKRQEQDYLQDHPDAVQLDGACVDLREVLPHEIDDSPIGYLPEHVPSKISKGTLIRVTGEPKIRNAHRWP